MVIWQDGLLSLMTFLCEIDARENEKKMLFCKICLQCSFAPKIPVFQ